MQGKSPLTKQTLQLLAKMSLAFLCMIKLLLAVPFYTRGHMFGALPDGLQRDLCPPLRTELVIVGLLGERVKQQILQRSPTAISHDPALLWQIYTQLRGGKEAGIHNTRLTYLAQSHSKNRIATSMQLPKNRKINKSANSIYQLQLIVPRAGGCCTVTTTCKAIPQAAR